MPHPRKLMRDAVVAHLVGKTAADGRVTTSREIAWRSIELPSIAVYTKTETSEAASIDRDLHRVAKLVILVVSELTEFLDDDLDERALEVETAMKQIPTLNGLAEDSVLVGTVIEIGEEQRRAVGAVELTFDVEYYT